MRTTKGAASTFSWFRSFLIWLEAYSGRSGLMKRKKNFPLLILVGVSIVACGLYYATYFQAVASSSWQWKSTHWFGLRSSSSSSRDDKSFSKKPELIEKNGGRGLYQNRLISLHPSYNSGDGDGGGQGREEDRDGEDDDDNVAVAQTSTSSTDDDDGDEERESHHLSCHLPKLDPMDKSIVEFVKAPEDIDCQESYPLVFRTDFHSTLIQLRGFKSQDNVTCCYRSIRRGNFSDRNIEFSRECFPIESERQDIPAEHEFIYIRCKNGSLGANSKDVNGTRSDASASVVLHRDMFAFVPLKGKRTDSEDQVTSEGTSSRLGKERVVADNEKAEEKDKDERLNVVILGLDAQSHMNFLRQMPLTSAYLLHNLSAISLHGYTKVSDNTFPNIVPLLTGLNVTELKLTCWGSKDTPFDDCPFIWKRYARHGGYHTSFAEDSVWMGAFNYNKAGFARQPTDYYLHPLTNLMAKKIGHHTSGNSELCYGPRLGFEVLLDYLVKTAVTFAQPSTKNSSKDSSTSTSSSRYFQFIWATSLFHDYLNNPRLGDQLLYLTFQFLYQHGYLNRTAFLLISDHGIRWGAIRTTYQGKIEERMPLAYLIFPEWFHRTYPLASKALQLNSKRLTTPFDLHQLLNDLLYQTYKKKKKMKNPGATQSQIPARGYSLFAPIPPNRTCEDADIAEHWCVCNALESLPVNSSMVREAAGFILERINGMLSHLEDYCAHLELGSIYEAMKTIQSNFEGTLNTLNNNSHNSNRHTQNDDNKSGDAAVVEKLRERITLQVTIVTKPGDGMFEGTVSKTKILRTRDDTDSSAAAAENEQDDRWQLAGEISRISLYGSSSSCISNFFLQKYCYCLDNNNNVTIVNP